MINRKFIKRYFIYLFLAIVLALAVRPVVANAEVLDLKIAFSKPSPIKVGETVEITASAAESDNILYKFWIYDGASWNVVQDYSSDNTYTWTPNHAAQQKVWVDVKDRNSVNSSDSHKEVVYDVNSTVKIDSVTTSITGLIPKGSSVEIRANSIGGKDPLYRFWIYDGQAWSVLQNYSRNNVAVWKPSKSGTNRIWVDVKESNSLYDKDNYKDMSCQITDVAKINDITFSKPSPINVGETIEITASATESNNILYKFWIFDGASWNVVQDYSSDNTYTWTPNHAAQQRVWVDVKDRNSVNGSDSHKEVVYNVNSTVKIDSVTTSITGLIPKGSSVEIKANSIGGKDPIYRFWIYDGQAWSVLQNYSRNNSTVWKPSKSGTNRILVDVKESNSLYDKDNYRDISCQITNGAKLNDITFSKPSPINVGETVEITATATESDNILYKFWIYDGASWNVVQDYSSDNTYTWTPNHAAQQRVWVDVKDRNSVNGSDSHKEVVYDVNSTVKIDSVTTSITGLIPKGSSVEIRANSIGGKDPLYRFWIYDGQAWSVLQNYSRNNTAVWRPSKSGINRIWVDVKESNSLYDKDNYKDISCQITDVAKINDITFSKPSPIKVGETVEITASATESNNILYKFWIFDGASWNVVQDYSSDNTYTWTPNHAAQQKVWVDVKDRNSVNSSDSHKEIVYDVNSNIYFNSITTSLSSPQNLGNNITITGNYTSNESLLYRFWVFDGFNWKVVRDYSSIKNYVWIPEKAGNYKLWIDVKAISSLKDVDYSSEITYIIENKPVIQKVYTNYSSPMRANSIITITASAIYGENNLFRFWIYDGYGWYIAQGYSYNNTYIWNPKTEGNYKIWVDVKRSGSGVDVEASKEISFNIVKYGIMTYVNYSSTLDYYALKQVSDGSPVYSNGVSWLPANIDQVKQYMNSSNYINDDRGVYQFMKLTYTDGILAEDLNNVLRGKGVLENKGDIFIRAGQLNNINPIYLVSHALLETGNGTSVLATGGQREDNSKPISDTNKPVYGIPVYNMYGVGAYDGSAIASGTTFAYNQKWFTVDDAIIGGASFIGNSYIKAGRDTLYKMRWNFDNIYKQYATDIRWAYNQTYNIKLLIDQMRNSIFVYEVPIFKQ